MGQRFGPLGLEVLEVLDVSCLMVQSRKDSAECFGTKNNHGKRFGGVSSLWKIALSINSGEQGTCDHGSGRMSEGLELGKTINEYEQICLPGCNPLNPFIWGDSKGQSKILGGLLQPSLVPTQSVFERL